MLKASVSKIRLTRSSCQFDQMPGHVVVAAVVVVDHPGTTEGLVDAGGELSTLAQLGC